MRVPPSGAFASVFFCATQTLGVADLASAVAMLSTEERQRYERFRFVLDRREYAFAHALLRTALTRCAGGGAPESWRFATRDNGKPYVVSAGMAPFDVNLSHCPGMVACAIGRPVQVGIDVESTGRVHAFLEVARRYFRPAEFDALRSLPEARQEERFVELWCLKEAFGKALGDGVVEGFDRIAFDLTTDGVISFAVAHTEDGIDWDFELFAPTDRHRIALAIASPTDAAECPIEIARVNSVSAPTAAGHSLRPTRTSRVLRTTPFARA